MKNSIKIIITAIIVAVPAAILGHWMWPPTADLAVPSPVQMPFFIGLAIINALAFGLGVAVLIFGWRRAKANSRSAFSAFLAVVWSLVSWLPHHNLHQYVGDNNLTHLLAIEYGFHVTLIVAAVFIGSYLWRALVFRPAEGINIVTDEQRTRQEARS